MSARGRDTAHGKQGVDAVEAARHTADGRCRRRQDVGIHHIEYACIHRSRAKGPRGARHVVVRIREWGDHKGSLEVYDLVGALWRTIAEKTVADAAHPVHEVRPAPPVSILISYRLRRGSRSCAR